MAAWRAAPSWKWIHGIMGALFALAGFAALTSPFQTFGLLAVLTPAWTVLPPLGFSLAATAILILVAAWEAISLRPKEA